ncbi:MAG: head GIN domain-containing protein [Roseiflexaceae bacterium]|nr:head GIN domain-containing protein [Roseiflexaceae bacterium]
MRMMRCFILFALLAVILTGCGGMRGSGNVTTTAREVGAFTAVDVSGVGEIVITQGQTESLTVETDDNFQDVVLSEVRGDTLHLGMKPNASMSNITKMILTVTARDLKRITFSGAGMINVRELNGDQLTVDQSGAGKITIAGTVQEQHVTLSGAGSYDGAALVSNRATITLSGLGNAIVQAREQLDATISGAGSIEYIGNPQVNKQISGLGSVRQRTQ